MSESARFPLVRCLSFHADYRCGNSGVCCSSGWDIAVEEPVELQLRSRLQAVASRLPNGPDGFVPNPDLPTGCRSMFKKDSRGSCWFHDLQGRRCVIHTEFGETSLPSACRQFPRICVLEPETVSVSLSHYCPTAAGRLFQPHGRFEIVDSPAAFPPNWPFEGLDVRGAYSPFIRPGVLLGFDGLRAFERSAIGVLAVGEPRPALNRIRMAARRIEGWTPTLGDVPDFVEAAFASAADLSETAEPLDPRSLLLDSLPEGGPAVPDLPSGTTPGVPSIRPRSQEVDLALCRYLAARLVGSWIPFQVSRLSAVARYLELCIETATFFEASMGRGSEVARWKEAIRNADLWLLHHCDPERLASNLE